MNFLRQFHNIVSDQNTDFSEKITELLKFGLDVFNLDFAIISRVENNVYTVIHVIAPDDAIAVGTQFELSGTYCTHTLTANKAISFHQASKSTIAEHPCYLNFKLESYIGAPIFVGNKVFGTLNFSAPQPSLPFNDDAHDYVELFAQWLGNEFARNSASKKLIKKKLYACSS